MKAGVRTIRGKIPGLLIFEPQVHGDSRGLFMELWRGETYATAGLPEAFAQDNLSRSRRGVLRGLHFQQPGGQGKLVTVIEGEVFDVAVDVRHRSPHFGRWQGLRLSGESKRQFWIPPGFAHGYEVVSETALFHYKCTSPYRPEYEGTVLWNDPRLGISWNSSEPELSEKDRSAPALSDIPPERLPPYKGNP